MLKTIDNNKVDKIESYSRFKDELLFDYYNNYFDHLSSRQLDKEFNKDLSIMIKSLKKLSQEERSIFVNSISRLIAFYLESKMEKELDKSFHTLFKF